MTAGDVLGGGHHRAVARLAVRETEAANDSRWNAFVAEHPEGTGYHHSGWLTALHREYGTRQVHLVCEDEAGTVQGVLPLVYTRGLPLRLGGPTRGRRLASLPRTPIGGPLASSPAVAQRLIEAAVEVADAQPGTLLQLRRMRPDLDGLGEGLVGHPWRPAYVLSLPPLGERLLFGDARNHRRIRWAVNKAEREGVTVRRGSRSDVRPWYDLYLQTMRAHVVPPRPLRLFVSLLDIPELAGVVELQVAEADTGGGRRLIAGSFFLRFGATVSYAFNGVDPRSLRLRPNDALQWHAIHAAWRDGFRVYDLGEVTDDNDTLSDFKRKWGASSHMMFRYYHRAPQFPFPRAARMSREANLVRRGATVVWGHLPLPVTAMLGSAAWNFL